MNTIAHLRMGIRLLLLTAVAVVAVAILLSWDRPAHESAEAAGSGPEIALAVTAGGTACPGGFDPADACVLAGNSFTLIAQVVAAPAVGYVAVQTFIDYATFNPSASEDGAEPGSCNDASDNGDNDGADRFDTDCVTTNLIYTSGAVADEIVWPDLEPATAVKAETGPSLVNHGGLTGLLTQPKSNFIGSIVELAFTCSASSTSTDVQLLPQGNPIAGTSGAAFVDINSTQIVPKVSNLTIHCLGPTPTPTITPIPDTPTPTVSPTPTETPTSLPPPSQRPDVSVTKVDLSDPVDANARFTYRITVTSVGLQTAEGVVVMDTPPSGTTDIVAVSADANCKENAGTVTCTVKDPMARTDEVIIFITVTAPSPVDDTRISNTVTVTSTNEPFANTGNNKDTEETVILAPRSDVTLTKISDPTFIDGDEDVTYILVAKNVGPHTAENVVVSDTLPGNAAFVSSSAECGDPAGGKVTCSLGDIAPGGEKIVNIVMHSPPVTRNIMLKNSAFVTADNELFVQTGNNTAGANTPVVAPPPDLVVTKTDSADPVLRLGFYSYSITILNQGDGDALFVVFTDTLPTSSIPYTFGKADRTATFVSATGAVCVEIPNGKVECRFDEINVGQQKNITLNVRAPTLLDDQTITNNVTVTASDPDENPAGNDASETTDLKACFDVNGDLVVDLLFDILSIVNKFGFEVGDPEYDVIFDFDGDGTIGLLFDILPVLQHFGQDCSLLL